MSPSGEEIRRSLEAFASKWREYAGSERGEAQTFLNELLACFGTDRSEVAEFEHWSPGGFQDMVWPGVCLVEMKRPSEGRHLEVHRTQALDYWRKIGKPDAPAPRFVVLSSFQRFEVFEPGAVYGEPKAQFDLDELVGDPAPLLFLAGDEPYFAHGQEELTREAVALVSELDLRLRDRGAAPPETVRDFVLQSVWSMFAEDLGLLPSHLFSHLLDELLRDPHRSSADELGQLFTYLAEPEPRPPTAGAYAGTPYANGGLFAEPARVHLEQEEVELLRNACGFDWGRVEPAIFGGLLQGALGKERQWALGAHYTAEADILEIVRPTIVDPWRERLAACETLEQIAAAQGDLLNYVVLDPACGSGNFLYVAYRELRLIERDLRERAAELRQAAGLADQETLAAFFPITNMHGIDNEPFAVGLARMTMWMGHKLAVNELGVDEATLPLADLSTIRQGDALAIDWPQADAVIGNPPYFGSQQLRTRLGDEYVEWLKTEFGVGVKDYCVYWFRKAHEQLEEGGRAGLVGTNSISQNRARGESLQYIVDQGGVITDAVSKQPWSGEAVVNVSIVNWIKAPMAAPTKVTLDGDPVEGITPALRAEGLDVSQADRLPENRSLVFQGPIPAGDGFVLAPEEARELLAHDDADYSHVVRPYLIGKDIAEDPHQSPRRWIIDFNELPLEDASEYPNALDKVRERVKPFRDTNRDRGFREKWWLFGRPRPAMRSAISDLTRYVAGNAQGKRIFFAWQDPATCPSNLTNVFAFDDDYSMGVLLSSPHHEWARQWSTLRVDIRYTPTSAFETFPWPAPSPEQRERIADAASQVIARRQIICAEREIGLTTLYNEVDDGAYTDLRALHGDLDRAVAGAYGWPAGAASDAAESNRLLLELNRRIAAGEIEYSPFD